MQTKTIDQLDEMDGKRWLMTGEKIEHNGHVYICTYGFGPSKIWLKDKGYDFEFADSLQSIFITNDPQFKKLHAKYLSSKQYHHVDDEFAVFVPAFNTVIFHEDLQL